MADRGYRGRPQRGERSDRQINAGHSRGLDAALSKTEAKIRNLKTERVYVYDKNGKLLGNSTKGTKNRTAIPADVVPKLKDAVITHNHPGDGLYSSFAGKIGRSLSGIDLKTTISNNASEMRAVTGTYTYSIKRPKGGWNMTDRQVKRISSEVQSAVQRNFDNLMDYVMIRTQHGRRTPSNDYIRQSNDRAQVLAVHSALRDLAKKYGWNYTRKRTN